MVAVQRPQAGPSAAFDPPRVRLLARNFNGGRSARSVAGIGRLSGCRVEELRASNLEALKQRDAALAG
jgi:hypothetical protein